MRMSTLMGTAAAALTAAMVFAAPANADRVCHQVCDDYGFCRSRCFDSGDRLYMYDRDSDYYYDHRNPSIELYGPGIGVEIR